MDNQNPQDTTGAFNSRFTSAPTPLPSAWDVAQQRLKREDSTSTGQYAGAMWRQDSVTNGLVAHLAGLSLEDDPNYSPYTPDEWKDLTTGVSEDFHKYFGNSRSAAHARYIKDLILEKQSDLEKLGDLGIAGNIGRFALGAVSPENLLTGMGGGLVSRARQSYKVAQATRAASTEAGAAVAKAGVLAEQAAAASKAGSVAAGVATGGAGNAAFEALRQSVNFEDDETAVLEATLIGAGFTTPFALAGAKQARRVANAAADEHATLKVMAKAESGAELTPAEVKLVDKTYAAIQVAKQVEDGSMSLADARKALTGDDRAFLDKLGNDFATRREAVLDELFPTRVADRTRTQLGLDGQPLALGYDPNVGQPGRVPLTADAAGNVSRGADMRSKMEELNTAHATMAAEFKKLDAEWRKLPKAAQALTPRPAAPAPREAWVNDQLTKMAGFAPREVAAVRVEDHKAAKKADPVAASTPQVAASPEAPAVPAQRRAFEVGRVVDFTNKKTGAENSGVIESIREDGWLMVRDEDGKVVPVPPAAVYGGLPPEGFLPGSIGAAQRAPVGADGDPALQLTRMSKVRLDLFATLNRSKSESVRSLVFSLVKDPIQTDSMRAQGMAASEWKSQLKRTIAGTFHREGREAAREAAKAMQIKPWQVPQFYHEFHSLVTRVTRNEVGVLNDNPAIAPMLQKAASAQKKVYADMLREMQAAGVKGAENIDPNATYVNRVWNQRAIREAKDKYGNDAVNQLLANAIKVPGLTGDVAKAARFLDAVQRLEYSKVMQNVHLYAEDMGTLRGLLQKEGLDSESIDVVVDAMFMAKEAEGSDKGRMASLKYRFDLDETLSMETGNGRLAMADLLENDARVLVDTYVNSGAGHIAMAKHHIFSEADFQSRLKEVQDEAIAKGLDVKDDLTKLQDIYNNIVGRPMSTQDFSTTARAASALRGYTRSAMLGQLGLTAAFEMKQAIGLMGFRAFMSQMPAFRGFIQAVRNGYIPDARLARDVEVMVGFGNEMSSSYARAQEIDDGFMGQTLSRVEQVANTASHAVDIMSGNASFTSLTRQLSSMMAIQRLADFSNGKAALTPKLRERLVGWGVDDEAIGLLMEHLKTHAELNDKGVVQSINYEAWSREAPGTYQRFQTVLSRMTRDAIQDQDLGETIPFMHSTLGKVFGELKTFFLVAHAKNMLKNLSYGDATALQVLLIGMAGEAIAYSTQVSLNYAHDPAKRDELLAPDAIAWAAFGRSPVAGMVPFFVGQGYNVASGGQNLFGPDSTANTGNRTFVPPSLLTVQRLASLPSTVMGIALNNGQVTQSEGLNAWKSLPLNNMLGMRNIGSILSSTLPKQEAQSD